MGGLVCRRPGPKAVGGALGPRGTAKVHGDTVADGVGGGATVGFAWTMVHWRCWLGMNGVGGCVDGCVGICVTSAGA